MATKQKADVCLAVSEVVKQGYLFVKRPPRRYFDKLKAWHKRYFVLRDETEGPVLEMYDNQTSAINKITTKPQICLDLNHAVHIGLIEDTSRFPFCIVVVCHGKAPLVLASDDELGGKSWLLALSLVAHKGSTMDPNWRPVCERRNTERIKKRSPKSCSCSLERQIHDSLSTDTEEDFDSSIVFEDIGIDTSFLREKFSVTVHPTKYSEKAGLRGEVDLAIFTHGIGVVRPGETDCSLVWPVAFIRQYRHETLGSNKRSKNTLVSLEVGRRCLTGEGIFQFKTQQGEEIIQALKRTFAMWAIKRQTSLSLRQARSDQRVGSQRHLCYHAGCSEPSTPLLSLTQSYRKKLATCSNQTKAKEVESDINYIIPNFDNSPDSNNDDDSLENIESIAHSSVKGSMKSLQRNDPTKEKEEEDDEEEAYIEVLPT
ncbi:docking protein 2-like [Centruroides sculpturatus]|uniref:docking protein 2-like n=1 Tax=Centruroides sculpturatus TaxID=218467 RepID=UPI000C6EFFD2|nr:docking protein 2-like [Centruroides sculpturatus]